ncbi:MAG: site-specific integrase [Planctomycetaceae bacterium]|nr:site-specific integrase [Planctomycetaceae bacterium]
MASISRDPNGYRRILFVATDGKRRTLRLGKVSQRAAEVVKGRVEQLLAAKLTGHALEADTASWVAEREPTLTSKLAAVGLIPRRDAAESVALGHFIAEYIAKRTDAKPRTIINLRSTATALVGYFGAVRPLKSVTPGEAVEWRLWMQTEKGLADNTIRRHCGRAKQFYRHALKRRLVADNPFGELKSRVTGNPERFYFISRSEAEAVLKACPDTQWRLLFALSRFGGLRCPSEHLALRWGDVDWERGRLTVRSPKTEHIPGHESRIVPLFPELRPYLEAAFDEAEPGTEFVITLRRDANTNLRTRLTKIIQRAGLKPWERLWHNLRATRQTELAGEHPAHVVCTWLGNSEAVAREHYLHVTDTDFDRALCTRAAQNPAQQPAVSHCNASQAAWPAHEKTPVLPGFATMCETLPNRGIPPRGVEPLLPD